MVLVRSAAVCGRLGQGGENDGVFGLVDLDTTHRRSFVFVLHGRDLLVMVMAEVSEIKGIITMAFHCFNDGK